MPTFHITLSVEAEHIGAADDIACALSEDCEGLVVKVKSEDCIEVYDYKLSLDNDLPF